MPLSGVGVGPSAAGRRPRAPPVADTVIAERERTGGAAPRGRRCGLAGGPPPARPRPAPGPAMRPGTRVPAGPKPCRQVHDPRSTGGTTVSRRRPAARRAAPCSRRRRSAWPAPPPSTASGSRGRPPDGRSVPRPAGRGKTPVPTARPVSPTGRALDPQRPAPRFAVRRELEPLGSTSCDRQRGRSAGRRRRSGAPSAIGRGPEAREHSYPVHDRKRRRDFELMFEYN